MKLNQEQQWAVAHGRDDGALLVSAAAGSGKTSVMARRVARLLSDPQQNIRADRIFVATFTNAAAAELRSRISKALTDALDTARAAGDASLCAYLQRQRVYLQRAAIGTVDSYCLRLLREHFTQLDIPPDFEIAEEAQTARLERQAVQAVTEELLTQSEDFRALAGLYGRSREEGKVQELILRLYRFVQSFPDPEQRLERFAAQWRQGGPVAATEWGRVLAEQAMRRLQIAEATLDAARRETEEHAAPDDRINYTALFARDLAALDTAQKAVAQTLKERTAESWKRAGKIPAHERWPSDRKATPEQKRVASDLKKLRDEAWREVDKALEPFCRFDEVEAGAAPMAQALAGAARQLSGRLWELKKQEKRYSFSDCEQLALRLLWQDGQRTALAQELSRGFATVMVDEYQDTNRLQDTIYRCLADPQGSNLFLVGDIKQSIYRFRQANPAVFLEKLREWQPYAPQDKGSPRALALNANYRSAQEVIDGVNAVFDAMMTRELGGVDYKDPSQQLYAGAKGAFAGSFTPVLLGAGADGAGGSRAQRLDREAAWVARTIRGMLQAQTPVRGETQELRPVAAEDICIILRSRAGFPAYLTALEKEGIPAYGDAGGDLLSSQVVRPLACLLRVLDNPAQDMPLAGCLLSPLFGFTPDDLVRMRAVQKHGGLYAALCAAAAEGQEKCAAVCEQLARWGELAFSVTIDRLIEEILAETGYPAAVSAREDGEAALQELEAFTGWAAGKSESGLHRIIRRMDAIQAGGRGLERAGGGHGRPGCVTVLTAHACKGLEFPVVFVGDLSHQFNRQDTQAPVLLHRSLGIGIKVGNQMHGVQDTAARRAVSVALSNESAAEEMRILYVALTRAKDHLILPMVTAEEPAAVVQRYAQAARRYGPAAPMRSLSAVSWQDWLLTGLCLSGRADSIRGEPLPALTDGPDRAGFAQRAAAAPADQALCARLQARWQAWEDDADRRKALEKVPVKTSVSALTHGTLPLEPARPAFARTGAHLTGAQRGTLTHLALQFIDFVRPFDLDAQLARIAQRGLMTGEELAQLDRGALAAFAAHPAFDYICGAPRRLREYPFITSVPASVAMADTSRDLAGISCLVQGVADLVLLFDDHAEIWDYKTDRNVTAQDLADMYQAQLWLYRAALEKRLPVPVTRCVIYSLSLGDTVEVPML